jgi:membrane associated rhomboid family serine protease
VIFPISDDNRERMSPAWVCIGLLLANVAFFIVQLMDPAFTYGWSVIPYEITHGVDLPGPFVNLHTGHRIIQLPEAPGPHPIYLTILSAMFMHGGWAHIGGNMLYLWIFGDNVEHRFGALKFLLFYLVSGIIATIAQIATDPNSLIPNLGASGAISGVLGAYLVLFPRNRVNAVFFFRIVSLPAVFVIGMWALLQFVNGAGSITDRNLAGGVAYAAHIGGFVAGVVMGIFARMSMKNHEPPSAFRRIYEEERGVRRYW